MEKEKESFLQGESFQDVDPKFAESRLVPLLDQLFELIKLEFSHTLNSVKRMDLFVLKPLNIPFLFLPQILFL